MSSIGETISYFHKGGLVMWPLLLCSLAVIAIAIERFLYYRSVDSKSSFVEDYCEKLAKSGLDAATDFAASSAGKYPAIVADAAHLEGSREEKAAYIEMESGIFIATLRDKLDYLSIIVTMAPLLGLLGTIVGMIGAFSIFNLREGAPMAITGGIGEALIATATGLCVAILALIVHSYFSHRMDLIINNMEECFSAFLRAEIRSRK